MISRFNRNESVVFRATKDRWGGLSNMAAGYGLLVNGHLFRTSEALYQALRYTDDASEDGVLIQELIRQEKSPMAAKMVSKKYYGLTRDDWDFTRVKVMDWCLRAKLHAHWDKFGELLLATGSLPIVEESHKDRFWGAVPLKGNNDVLEGENTLGYLLARLRSHVTDGRRPNIEEFPIAGMTVLGLPPLSVGPAPETDESKQIGFFE
jgi:ribA/ribD-fused uncharacterized protein